MSGEQRPLEYAVELFARIRREGEWESAQTHVSLIPYLIEESWELADAIADVVETGTTLRNQGLTVFGDPILRSEAVLIRDPASSEQAAIDVLVRRLTGVVTARTYVMLDYDCPAALVDRACAITPGLESPTVSPLQNPDWVAVRAMVPRRGTNAIMDELYELGARAILVTDITACRL